jgi:preprotein translocase subunit YajC
VDDDRATAPCGAIATVVERRRSVLGSLFIMVFMFATWWKVVMRKERRKDEAK